MSGSLTLAVRLLRRKLRWRPVQLCRRPPEHRCARMRHLRDRAGRPARLPVPTGRHQPQRPQPEPLQPLQHPRGGRAGRRVDGALRGPLGVHGDDPAARPGAHPRRRRCLPEGGHLRAGPPRRLHRQVRRRRRDGVLQRADPLRGSRRPRGRRCAGDRGRDAGPRRAVRRRPASRHRDRLRVRARRPAGIGRGQRLHRDRRRGEPGGAPRRAGSTAARSWWTSRSTARWQIGTPTSSPSRSTSRGSASPSTRTASARPRAPPRRDAPRHSGIGERAAAPRAQPRRRPVRRARRAVRGRRPGRPAGDRARARRGVRLVEHARSILPRCQPDPDPVDDAGDARRAREPVHRLVRPPGPPAGRCRRSVRGAHAARTAAGVRGGGDGLL